MPKEVVTLGASMCALRRVVGGRQVGANGPGTAFVAVMNDPTWRAGADSDGDGVRWCDDCRDMDPTVHPGAAEVCGNGVDDDCDGVVDDGCPPVP